MSAESILNAALLAAGPVTAIVGTAIYPDVVPQETAMPSVAFSRVSTEDENTIHGNAPAASRVTLQIACMAKDPSTAADLAAKVETAARGAGYVTTDKRSDYDAESRIYASVITAAYWEIPA